MSLSNNRKLVERGDPVLSEDEILMNSSFQLQLVATHRQKVFSLGKTGNCADS